MKKFFLISIVFVLIEIAMFIIIGNWLGVLSTLLLILLASVLGVAITKKQGLKSLQNIRDSINRGEPPGYAMVDAFLVFLAGVLFLLPGFISDLIAFTMALPWTRQLYKPMIVEWIRKRMENNQVIIIRR
ncbi:FxsA family protein [Ureibacillus thermophilus]|uniref:FxsA family protein n=1 Tax=Ureibacillus thermophilus TaxID=367743 RepID=A0A4P6UW07_9BACL|nr:FxsA family protein [Ureibacillus thermophilus]QBK26511.1 FxsA family protein [Ureibacillus thermophilus]